MDLRRFLKVDYLIRLFVLPSNSLYPGTLLVVGSLPCQRWCVIKCTRAFFWENAMKLMTSIIGAGLAIALAGCTTSISPSSYEPIPGSITYNGQPRTKLTKSPIGSTFTHNFRRFDDRVVETYQIQPDRSLKIIDRRIIRNWSFLGRDD